MADPSSSIFRSALANIIRSEVDPNSTQPWRTFVMSKTKRNPEGAQTFGAFGMEGPAGSLMDLIGNQPITIQNFLFPESKRREEVLKNRKRNDFSPEEVERILTWMDSPGGRKAQVQETVRAKLGPAIKLAKELGITDPTSFNIIADRVNQWGPTGYRNKVIKPAMEGMRGKEWNPEALKQAESNVNPTWLPRIKQVTDSSRLEEITGVISPPHKNIDINGIEFQ